MQVIATQMGFFNGRRIREGQEFEVPDGTTSKWFHPVDTVASPKAQKAKKGAERVPTALSELGATPTQSFTESVA